MSCMGRPQSLTCVGSGSYEVAVADVGRERAVGVVVRHERCASVERDADAGRARAPAELRHQGARRVHHRRQRRPPAPSGPTGPRDLHRHGGPLPRSKPQAHFFV